MKKSLFLLFLFCTTLFGKDYVTRRADEDANFITRPGGTNTIGMKIEGTTGIPEAALFNITTLNAETVTNPSGDLTLDSNNTIIMSKPVNFTNGASGLPTSGVATAEVAITGITVSLTLSTDTHYLIDMTGATGDVTGAILQAGGENRSMRVTLKNNPMAYQFNIDGDGQDILYGNNTFSDVNLGDNTQWVIFTWDSVTSEWVATDNATFYTGNFNGDLGITGDLDVTGDITTNSLVAKTSSGGSYLTADTTAVASSGLVLKKQSTEKWSIINSSSDEFELYRAGSDLVMSIDTSGNTIFDGNVTADNLGLYHTTTAPATNIPSGISASSLHYSRIGNLLQIDLTIEMNNSNTNNADAYVDLPVAVKAGDYGTCYAKVYGASEIVNIGHVFVPSAGTQIKFRLVTYRNPLACIDFGTSGHINYFHCTALLHMN